MSELGNWVLPVLSLLIPILSLAIAILTYLRVSRKYVSKTLLFHAEHGNALKAKEERVLFNIKGAGSLQRLEMLAEGCEFAMITLLIDGEVCWQETFDSLHRKASPYLTVFKKPGSVLGEYGVQMDMQKNFYANMELSIDNKHDSKAMEIRGTVQYDILEKRVHFFTHKKRR
jgi:hypothetical protein